MLRIWSGTQLRGVCSGSLLLVELSLIQERCLRNRLVLLIWWLIESTDDLTLAWLYTRFSIRLSEDIFGLHSWDISAVTYITDLEILKKWRYFVYLELCQVVSPFEAAQNCCVPQYTKVYIQYTQGGACLLHVVQLTWKQLNAYFYYINEIIIHNQIKLVTIYSELPAPSSLGIFMSILGEMRLLTVTLNYRIFFTYHYICWLLSWLM